MKIQLMDITMDSEEFIAKQASICYDSDINDPEKLARRIKHLVKLKHLTTLRFANATFHIEGISRVCTHQLVRTAHAGFLQRSQRYVLEEGIHVVIPPSYDVLSPYLQNKVLAHIDNSSELYMELVEAGVPKEDARFMLLEGSESQINMTGNFQTWYEWLSKRTHKSAQWEIRELANSIANHLNKHAPNIFGEYCGNI